MKKLINGNDTHECQEHNPTIAVDSEAGLFHSSALAVKMNGEKAVH